MAYKLQLLAYGNHNNMHFKVVNKAKNIKVKGFVSFDTEKAYFTKLPKKEILEEIKDFLQEKHDYECVN